VASSVVSDQDGRGQGWSMDLSYPLDMAPGEVTDAHHRGSPGRAPLEGMRRRKSRAESSGEGGAKEQN
jgi:hypothetical protein